MNVKWGLAALAGLAMTGLSVGTVLATTSTTPKASILGQAEFSDFDLNSHTIPADVWHAIVHTQGQSDLYVVDNSIPHGTTTGWHSHPGPSWVLVVRGTVTTTPLTIAVGLRTDSVHMLRNNSATDDAETIAVQLIPHGANRRIDEPVPTACGG